MGKIPVGISACLMGDEVRHNGGHKRDAYINGTLASYFSFHRFCPEVGIGLGVPRPAIRLVASERGIRAVGSRDSEMDVTEPLIDYSRQQLSLIEQLSGMIVKRASPSCGMERVKLYNDKNMPHPEGVGIFTREIMAKFPLLPVEEEGRLGDPGLRENFIQRVFIYHRWRTEYANGLSVQKLTEFHARHKLIFMSHDQDGSRELGRIAASARSENLDAVAGEYIALAMATLKKAASRKNHVNVLQHIQGYLKQQLDADDKQELAEVFERYRRGEIPLIVPITLLRHHFRRAPDEYIEQSWYLNPYPEELKLRNLV
ncbi:YbgA family protein [Porticoccus sp.]